MAISLVTNVDTTTVLRNLDRTQRSVSANIQKLSSGLRITKSGDDAAGLAISEQLKGLVRGLAQANRNGQDGISMIQVAEGALNEIHSSLLRMRELAVQSANGTQTDATRTHIHAEFTALRTEVDRISNSTDFNGQKLLNTGQSFTFQIGAFALTSENSISISIADMNTTALGGTVVGTSLAGTTVSTQAGSLEAISSIDQAITDVSTQRGRFGAAQNRLTFAIDNVSSTRENLVAANSRIRDVDVATETSEFTRNQILAQAGVSVLAQANQIPSLGLSLLR